MGRGVDHSVIRNASDFMVDLLLREDPSRKDTISIGIHLIDGYKESCGNIAECNYLDDRFWPTKFYIDLDSELSRKSVLITLGHELVHIKQMAFGHRQETLDGKAFRWMGTIYRPDEMHYYDLPWEIEAHGMEFGLYDRFVQSESGILLPPATIVDQGNNLRVA